MYSKICSKLHRTGQGQVLRTSASELNAFIYFTRIICAISYIDIILYYANFLKKFPVRLFHPTVYCKLCLSTFNCFLDPSTLNK